MKYGNEDYEKYIADRGFDTAQKMIIRLAFLAALEIETIDILAEPELNYMDMDIIRCAAIEGIPDEILTQMAKDPSNALAIKKEYYLGQAASKSESLKPEAEVTCEVQKVEDALSKEAAIEEMKAYIDLAAEKFTEQLTEKLEQTMALNLKEVEKKEAAEPQHRLQINKLFARCRFKESEEDKIIQLLKNTKYSDEQAELIVSGYQQGLSYDEIVNYADPEKSSKQMKDILYILLDQQKHKKDKKESDKEGDKEGKK